MLGRSPHGGWLLRLGLFAVALGYCVPEWKMMLYRADGKVQASRSWGICIGEWFVGVKHDVRERGGEAPR